MRYLVYLAVVAFLVCLVVSTIIVQASAGTLTETRRSAIVTSLSRENGDALGIAKMLLTLDALGGLNSIDVQEKLNLIISSETTTSVNGVTVGSWPTLVGFGNVSVVDELYAPYLITTVLRQFGAIGRSNITALLNFVMERYNATDSAFHEMAYEEQQSFRTVPIAFCNFPADQEAYQNGGYGESNMISTFLALSILANLNAIDEINVAKTINWILSCKADNGAFRPTLGDYWYNAERGWPSDTYNGTGIVYTYAALSALKILGVNVENVVNAETLRKYIMSCRETFSNGGVEFGTHYYNLGAQEEIAGDFYTTYYAIMLLNQMGALENETATVSGVVAYIKNMQDTVFNRFTNSWPIPHKNPAERAYGLNDSAYGLLDYHALLAEPFEPAEDYVACSILNITNSLAVLDEATPIASRTLNNLLELSAVVSVSTFGLSVVGITTFNRVRGWKEKKKTQPPSTPL